MKYNTRYILRHLSVRVPWHDNAWNGSICSSPKANGACLVLKNCISRNDEKEHALAGSLIKDLQEEDYPVCIGERATFMAPFAYYKTIKHPYAESSKETHGHLKPTQVKFPAYSAGTVPYHWMLKNNAKDKASMFDLNYDEQREPYLSWANNGGKDGWVQEYSNQKALLNCFFEHLEIQRSLVFFYAKQVSFYEGAGRVLTGIGRITNIIPSEAYEGSNSRFSAAYWEHMVMHSIREDSRDGFLLPYHAAIEYQKEHPEFDISSLAVIAPDDKRFEFSYAAEHVSNDSAIRVLLDCIKSLEKAEELGIGSDHQTCIKWIHNEVARLEKLRGFYPGMGAALCAFGIDKGHFVAAEIINNLKDDKENPWLYFEQALDNPKKILSPTIAELIPFNSIKLYKVLKEKANPDRLNLLYLLSRFDLTIEQATKLYVHEEREKFGLLREDKEYLLNPYLIYEDLRHTKFPVDLRTIDLGLYIKHAPKDIWPSSLLYNDPLHMYRIKALTIQQLERASLAGHTLLPRKEIVKQIRELSNEPTCQVNADYFELAEECFIESIVLEEMKSGERAYQLARFSKSRSIISQKVQDRIKGRRLQIDADWLGLLNRTLDKFTIGKADEQEHKARNEKAAALREIAESRFSVLIGPAGTGKTTLLTILASQKEVENNGVLLLAPTGKARVRMQEVARDLQVTSKTLAQFLSSYDRYNGDLQQYTFSEKFCEEKYETVILDEASMLTEIMLATTLDCLKGVKRLILVGDHRQLPPIGAGRPFIDIIHFLKPEGIETTFPRIGKGYAELTIKRRQGGAKREDLQLAEWFSGEPLEPGADSIINKVLAKPNSEFLRLEHWENESDFDKLFEKVLVEELGLDSIKDVQKFNQSLGSVDGKYFNFKEAANAAESWQILSPVRERVFGVKALNRKLHKLFREEKLKYARNKSGKIPAPIGLEEIVYGDKVINIVNSRRDFDSVWPQGKALNYIANGEIGMVIGQFKMPNHTYKGRPKNTEVEFASQKGYKYTFKSWEFKEEGDAALELAYALTVHKAQGSEFGKVFFIVPNPCLLLTREMLYTSLTRQKDKVIMLYQGSVFDIKELASPLKSDALKRITNLFVKPELVEVDGQYLEKNLIHQASDGKMLRSKSELLIYQRLTDKKLEPLYEKKLEIKDVVKLPDFTIENEETGETFYWEHCGMLYDNDYKQRWEEKYEWYRQNDILPFQEGGGSRGTLIITEDKPYEIEDGSVRGAISVKEIDNIIYEVFGK
jgi:ATP-dependent exoDNAse (exonuclease V) alpha subunit